jgi:hypothetical protein
MNQAIILAIAFIVLAGLALTPLVLAWRLLDHHDKINRRR